MRIDLEKVLALAKGEAKTLIDELAAGPFLPQPLRSAKQARLDTLLRSIDTLEGRAVVTVEQAIANAPNPSALACALRTSRRATKPAVSFENWLRAKGRQVYDNDGRIIR